MPLRCWPSVAEPVVMKCKDARRGARGGGSLLSTLRVAVQQWIEDPGSALSGVLVASLLDAVTRTTCHSRTA
jgi:hypothetical protein